MDEEKQKRLALERELLAQDSKFSTALSQMRLEVGFTMLFMWCGREGGKTGENCCSCV